MVLSALEMQIEFLSRSVCEEASNHHKTNYYRISIHFIIALIMIGASFPCVCSQVAFFFDESEAGLCT